MKYQEAVIAWTPQNGSGARWSAAQRSLGATYA
jgi:hypothetical protein